MLEKLKSTQDDFNVSSKDRRLNRLTTLTSSVNRDAKNWDVFVPNSFREGYEESVLCIFFFSRKLSLFLFSLLLFTFMRSVFTPVDVKYV